VKATTKKKINPEQSALLLCEHSLLLEKANIIIRDIDNRIIFWSKGAESLFGWKQTEAVGKYFHKLFEVRFREPFDTMMEKLFATGKWEGELIYKRKNGTTIPVSSLWLLRADDGKVPASILELDNDISSLKMIEHEITSSREQLRNFAAHIQSIREEERTAIAREIHDGLGQALTGLKMDLAWIILKLPKQQNQELVKKIESSSLLIDSTIKTVRRLTSQLRPGILDDLGLVAAIESELNEYQNRTGIRCTFHTEFEEVSLNKESATAVFRIVQESLTNILLHANASEVKISMKKSASEFRFTIQDNGKGISPEALARADSFGLLGMRERAAVFAGEVTINKPSPRGKGTLVTIKIPEES